MRLILASASAARAAILGDAGVAFDVTAPSLDEASLRDRLRAEGTDAGAAAVALALAKARSVAAPPGALVLGSDQLLVAPDGAWFAKPASPAEAEAQLGALAGRVHRLVSGAALVRDGATVWSGASVAALTLRALTPSEIAAYVADTWERIRWTVGCYEIEGAGVRLFARVDGDPWTIRGLPALALLPELRRLGVAP